MTTFNALAIGDTFQFLGDCRAYIKMGHRTYRPVGETYHRTTKSRVAVQVLEG
jgi:hypothetical protein